MTVVRDPGILMGTLRRVRRPEVQRSRRNITDRPPDGHGYDDILNNDPDP